MIEQLLDEVSATPKTSLSEDFSLLVHLCLFQMGVLLRIVITTVPFHLKLPGSGVNGQLRT